MMWASSLGSKQQKIFCSIFWQSDFPCIRLSCNRGCEFDGVSELKVTWSMINTVIKIEEIFGRWMISENGKKVGRSCWYHRKIKIRTTNTAHLCNEIGISLIYDTKHSSKVNIKFESESASWISRWIYGEGLINGVVFLACQHNLTLTLSHVL